MKRYSILYLLLFYLFFKTNYGQDATLSVKLNLYSKDTIIVTERNQNEYKVLWRIESLNYVNSWEYPQKHKAYYLADEKSFIISELKQYCKQIIELTIIHNTDSMIVRFKQDSLQKGYDGKSDCQHNTAFILKVPFQKGYYEITSLYSNKLWYTNKKTDWKHLKPKKRKLLVEDKHHKKLSRKQRKELEIKKRLLRYK